jgi:cytochrome c peroxidase
LLAAIAAVIGAGCAGDGGDAGGAAAAAAPAIDRAMLRTQANAIFGVLPEDAATEARPMTPERVVLGRALYYEPRLSRNHDISCNSCHQLDRFGVDGEPTSPGHRGQRGDRNSPTTLNAALQIAQFWDGRAPDVEAQAKGPILNPVEMAMPAETDVLGVLRSIPGYGPMFASAFPGEAEPITYDNLALAIGAFERGLITPGRFDRFMAGEAGALTDEELAGLQLFIGRGCVSCHNGPGVGGGLFRKLGLVQPYPTEDVGREKVTGKPEDRYVFKVPSLRNVAETGPWFHDGSLDSLDEVVLIMGRHQLGVELTPAERKSIVTFLRALTGEVDAEYVARPTLPPSGPNTPPADPS